MFSFGIHFLICNVFISLILAGILLAKKLLRTHLSGRTSYHIWILLPMLFIMPFLSVRPTSIAPFVAWFSIFKTGDIPRVTTNHIIPSTPSSVTNWINDFHISVTHKAPSIWYYLPFVIWCVGMFAMLLFMFWSRMRLYWLEKSALPLQNVKVKKLFKTCQLKMQLKRNIPIYSTAFLKSPIMVGLFRPRIYIPISLISDYNAHELRYILLHELQHYKHNDALSNFLINLSAIVYWFNPLVWYTLKEVRADREVACDSSVLEMLRTEEYTDYGNQDLSGGILEYWMESSLKISAFEQVELLKKLYTNEFHFQEQNVQAIKQALLLSSSEHTAFYGKTGTGNINGHSVNGWFIGYVEAKNNTYFFATNIQGTDDADGLTASEITKKILEKKGFIID